MAWNGMKWLEMTWNDKIWQQMIWNETKWNKMTQNDTKWHKIPTCLVVFMFIFDVMGNIIKTIEIIITMGALVEWVFSLRGGSNRILRSFIWNLKFELYFEEPSENLQRTLENPQSPHKALIRPSESTRGALSALGKSSGSPNRVTKEPPGMVSWGKAGSLQGGSPREKRPLRTTKPGTIWSMQNINRWRSDKFQPPFYLESGQTKVMQI